MEINYNHYWAAKDAINNVIGYMLAINERIDSGSLTYEHLPIIKTEFEAKITILRKAVKELEDLVGTLKYDTE